MNRRKFMVMAPLVPLVSRVEALSLKQDEDLSGAQRRSAVLARELTEERPLDLRLQQHAVRIAVCAARKCLGNFETAFDDDLPRKAIEAAERWCETPTDENRWLARKAETMVRSNMNLWKANRAACRAAWAAAEAARAARGGQVKALWSAIDAIYSEFRSNGGDELPHDDYRYLLSNLLVHLTLSGVLPRNVGV